MLDFSQRPQYQPPFCHTIKNGRPGFFLDFIAWQTEKEHAILSLVIYQRNKKHLYSTEGGAKKQEQVPSQVGHPKKSTEI